MKIRVNGSDLTYSRVGAGPPLLILGGIHLDHGYLRPWLDGLSSAAELIFHDVRGSPGSPHTGSFEEISHASWVADLEGLRQALGYERIFLFGHSYGGFLAQEYALRHPDKLHGLVLCSTAPALDYTDASLERARTVGTEDEFDAVITAFSAPVPDDATLESLWLRALPLYFHTYLPAAQHAFSNDVEYGAGAFNRGFFHCLPRFDTVDQLGDLRVPTLVLGGRHDWIAPPLEGPGRLHELLPLSELSLFEESGHFPFIEQSSEFVTTVSSWIDRTGPSPRSATP